MSKGWIGVDLDGTLAHHDGKGHTASIGDPIPLMVKRVKKWLAEGTEVRIVTARVSETNKLAGQHRLIQGWCRRHIGQVLKTTSAKDKDMLELWDDRAVRVQRNTGRRIR